MFYLDESGNSGDAIPKTIDNPFSDQPSFALVAIGLPENNNMNDILGKLKKKYKVQTNDVKTSKLLFHKKPGFIKELIEIIIENNYPLFIELMDKKYYIASNILQFYFRINNIDLKYSTDFFRLFVRNLAGKIADYFNIYVFSNYAQMCLNPSIENFIKFNRSFDNECSRLVDEGIIDNQLFSFILQSLREDLEEIESGELNENDVRMFIPPPDFNTKGEVLAMLPHVNAFCNIYARINHFISQDLGKDIDVDVEIIHDEQNFFDHILRLWETEITSNNLYDILEKIDDPSVSYYFNKSFSFQFSKSEDCLGIQLADVIAGFCTRYFNKTQTGCLNDTYIVHKEIVNLIAKLSHQPNSQGLNIVASDSSIKKFYSL
ncbi:MAG: DUF3800 domain-containing protein [Aphanizomenon gracile PMC638.10]|nr:DUF3800 domain-containing protein [Aphanizomenon gracile PMC638.10]